MHLDLVDDVERSREIATKFGDVGPALQIKNAQVRSEPNKKLINERLQEKKVPAQLALKPRRYQSELCEQALKENIIIYLGTGLGKTFIVVMYLNSTQVDSEIRLGRKVVFLAPTQDLVKQQAEYIGYKVPYKVKVYCGRTCHLGLHIDLWSKQIWANELVKNDVFFMTPQILASAISTNLLDWSQFSTIIFDEAHHACVSKNKNKGHPYKVAADHMDNYFRNYPQVPRPRVIGLTASLINNMPKDRNCILDGVRKLERNLNSKCVTDTLANESKPLMVIHSFDSPVVDKATDLLMRLFHQYIDEQRAVLELSKLKQALFNPGSCSDEQKCALAFHNRLKLAATGFSIKPSSFHKVLFRLAIVRRHYGLWPLAYLCQRLVDALARHSKNPVVGNEIRTLYLEFAQLLKKILYAIDAFVEPENVQLLLEYTQPKLRALLDVLSREHERVHDENDSKATFSCTVFVKSRLDVVAICAWLQNVSKKIPEYSFIKANYAVGMAATMSSKWACITKRTSSEQTKMLNDFRKGEFNVVVTTSVLEEGIDLPVCSTVIRFDKAESFRVYVQSRGRARQVNSTFVSICEEKDVTPFRQELNKFNDFECSVKEILSGTIEMPPRASSAAKASTHCAQSPLDREDTFQLDNGKILFGSSIAKIILHMYISRLTKQQPYSEGILYEREQPTPTTVRTTLFLPAGCPIKDCVVGNEKSNVALADSSAVVAAIGALYELNELNENAIPKRITEESMDQLLSKHQLSPDFTKLTPELEGEVNQESGFVCFPWKIFNLNDRLSRGFCTRKYKLFQIQFKGKNARAETLPFFEKPLFGLIVDSNRDSKLLPTEIFSHYGEFEVEYALINDSLAIQEFQTHSLYMNYTYNLAVRSVCLGRVDKEEFRARCLFYTVPLLPNGRVDIETCRAACTTSHQARRRFYQNDIVKLNPYYCEPKDRMQYFIVKQVRSDLNFRSKIPGTNYTFEDHVRRNYDDQFSSQVVRDVHQPIYEVVPIARTIARLDQGKKIDTQQESRSLFYIEQFLVFYQSKPEAVYQAFNLPPIIYKVYLATLVSSLENKFLMETASRRANVTAARDSSDGLRAQCGSAQEDPHEEEDLLLAAAAEDEDDQDENMDDEEECSEIDSDEEYEDEELNSTDLSEYESSDDEGDKLLPTARVIDILGKRELELRDKGDKMEKWDMSEYEVENLKEMKFEYQKSMTYQRFVDSHPKYSDTIGKLDAELRPHQNKILAKLEDFRKGIISEGDFPSEEGEINRLGCEVNPSISPPNSFDRQFNSFKLVSREASLLQALTQRRAGERVNLEALENIGDSYLKYVTSVLLFKCLPLNEGSLTLARMRLVSNKHFTQLAKKKGLGTYSIVNKFDPKILADILGATAGKKNVMREKDLADTVESIIGGCLIHGSEYEAILAIDWLGLNILQENMFHEFHEQSVAFSRMPSAYMEIETAERKEFVQRCGKRLKQFQKMIGYDFNDPSYLIQAFTHASWPQRCTENYERLEFLGDAILDFLVTMTLYASGRTTDPGLLSGGRSALVNNCAFAKLAIKYKYDLFLHHANQEIFDELTLVNDAIKTDPEADLNVVVFDKIVKLLGDLFESVAGAIYLDSGCSLDKVWSVYYPIMKDNIDSELANPTKNIVSQMYELFPGKGRISYSSHSYDRDGETIECITCNIVGFGQFYGEGLSKKQAKKRAIEDAMANPPSPEEKIQLDLDYFEMSSKEGGGRPTSRRGGGRGGPRGGGRSRGGRGARGGSGRGRGARGNGGFGYGRGGDVARRDDRSQGGYRSRSRSGN